MEVPMMDVRVVRVMVVNGLMGVRVGVRLATVAGGIVMVLMVLVVDMVMGVRDEIVKVGVLMVLGKMQRDARPHERSRHPEHEIGCLTKQDKRQRRTHEGRN
jgi:hypothetical protein